MHGDVFECRDDVGDVDEIPGLHAISEDGDGMVCAGFLQEDGNGSGVGAVWVLAGAEDIEEAQGGGVDAAFPSEHFQIVFAIQLGDRVGAFGLRDHVLGFGDRGVVAIDRRRAGEDEFVHPVVGSGFQDMQKSGDVEMVALDGFLHRLRHGDHRGEVKHMRDTGHDGVDQRTIGDAAPDEGVLEAVQVVEMTGTEIVQHDDFRGAALEVLDKVGTDEARAAGDEDFRFQG